ncbi:MAG: ATP cone domain-containing protein, partial [Verrucomicrobiota bacterium]
MIDQTYIEQDMELQRCAATPQEMKPRFDWSDLTYSSETPAPRILVEANDERSDLSIEEIAETVGKAITDLALSRNQEDIYNDANRQLVAGIVKAVTETLAQRAQGEDGEAPMLLSSDDLSDVIEQALVKQNAHEVAKSLLIRKKAADARRSVNLTDDNRPVCRVVRRNGEVVAWNPNKIEIAVRSAFLSLGMDSTPARGVANALTERFSKTGQEFIRIEDLQDRVQEELMRQGHYKVAEAYILYRAHRNNQRQSEPDQQPATDDANQESLIMVTRPDGSSDLWDGTDLRQRIAFATTGLDLCLSPSEIEQELRRAFYSEMTEEDLKKTIILNAKSLIEKDGDFAKLAGRILLTYIYEEVLDWSITRDGVSRLTDFHRSAFKANLHRGVEIERIHPRLLDYNLDKLADAINPAADLDFDYLGIQTLYDRYLIVDKTDENRHRRIETPQLFWMRVAMGLMVGEEDYQEEKIIDLYSLYASRRFCSSTPTLFNSGTMHSQLSS